MTAAWVFLHPLDVVTFRDGRPFSAGLTSTARTTLPRPTSTGGALKAVFGAEPDQIHGPLLVDVEPPATLLFPAPANLVMDKASGAVSVLHPDDPPDDAAAAPGVVCDLNELDAASRDNALSGGGTPEPEPGIRLLRGSGEPSPSYLDGDLLRRYLAGDAGDAATLLAGGGPTDAPEQLKRERRVGLALQERSLPGGRTAVPGFFYLAEFLRLPKAGEERIAFACEARFAGEAPPTRVELVKFGGEGRQAQVMVRPSVPGDGFGLPEPPEPADDANGGRVLLYLVTPAVFADGWLPPVAPGEVVAACVTGPEPVASWSPARGRPRPLRWAAGAGSVYFLQFDGPESAARFVKENHGTCLPQAHHRLRSVGFGLCLTGRW